MKRKRKGKEGERGFNVKKQIVGGCKKRNKKKKKGSVPCSGEEVEGGLCRPSTWGEKSQRGVKRKAGRGWGRVVKRGYCVLQSCEKRNF